MNIKDYGLKENLIKNTTNGRIPARILATQKERYEIVCDKGKGFAKSSITDRMSD